MNFSYFLVLNPEAFRFVFIRLFVENLSLFKVVNLRNVSQSRSTAPATIDAHDSEIVKLAIDNQATKIATGSIKVAEFLIFDVLKC